ncbi:MAG TPA: glycosyltransferase [bacterium]|nr:glycosyltransferase [bacterium]
MKVAIISWESFLGSRIGGWIQATKTVDGLARIGWATDHLLLHSDGTVTLPDKTIAGHWKEICDRYDILHAIPPIPSSYFRKIGLPRKAQLLASTIFWRSPTYTKVVQRESGKFSFKAAINDFAAQCGVRTILAYADYDMLLPNSQAEIIQFKKYCRYKASALFRAVPNGIDPVPEWVESLPRPVCVPKEDYLLYPGIFTYRKNQLNFIKAMAKCKYPIVFMGGGMGDGIYYDRCRAAAPSNMIFLGHLEHGSKEFYGVMKHARVACLASNCETPGIALLEAAALGVRPTITVEGGTPEYYREDASYLDPLSSSSIKKAVDEAWGKGSLTMEQQNRYREMTWGKTAQITVSAYRELLGK